MGVHIDRLYNFLDGVINLDDALIYRFCPHGSKNINDLGILKGYNNIVFNKIEILCHDQEPLDFYLYCNEQSLKLNDQGLIDKYPAAAEFRKQFGKGLKSATKTNGLNLNDCYLLVHSEKNSKQLDLYLNDGFIGVYYWSHALIARDWFRYAVVDPLLVEKKSWPSKDFLIYNRAWTGTREYRLKFSEMLVKNNLIENCDVRFNPEDTGIHYTDYKFNNPLFDPVTKNLEDYFELNTYHSAASADYDSADYNDSAIEVVLETLFDDSRIHLTEKILRPIACGKPWILAATAGSLEYLRDYGFKTFSPYIDESYDKICDPLSRLQAIIDECKRISSMPIDQKNALLTNLQKISEHNKKRFFSDDFFKLIVDEFKQNFQTALSELKLLRKGKNYTTYMEQLKERFPEAFEYKCETDPNFMRIQRQIANLSKKDYL